jgi:hypothetical protein
MWVKFGELDSSQHYISHLGTKGSALTFAGMYYSDNYGIRVVVGNEYRTSYHPPINEWIHVTYTYSGGTPDGTAGDRIVKFYVNGERVYFTGYYQRATGALALPSSSVFQVTGSSDSSGAANNHYESWVGNARLFSKALQATQVKELYDWQKDFFFGTKSTMTLTKGNLGLGASSPTDRLEVVGRVKADSSKIPTGVDRNNTVIRRETGPHDRPLTKYPEIAMTANDNSSTSGYVADQSSTNGYADGLAYRLFDHSTTGYQSGGSQYSGGNSTSSAQTTTATDGSTHQGVAITLDLATKIRLSYAKITSHTYYGRTPVEGTFLGSNDNSTWDVIGTFDGLSTTAAGQTHIVNIADYATKSAYRYIRLVVTKIHTSAVQNGGTLLEFRELEYYGYEEGDVSTDLVWSPVYNKPGTQHLDVYWDANDSNSYAGSGTTVTDLSGNGVTGTLSGVGFDSTYNAFTFDGSNDTITTTNSGLGTGGSFDHSFAFWFKINRNISNNDYVVTFGEETNDNMIAVNISGNSLIHLDNWGRGVITGDIVRLGTWYHVACTHTGSATGDINNQLIYVNGVRQTTVSTGTGTLAFTSNKITIGARPGGGTPTAFLDGAVSNVRFFKGKVLNADQVRELYEYDAPRFGHRQNLVSLHKGNLGVGVAHPTSRFEVAGTETLQEYPPKAMTGNDTYMEGHGVFRANWANWYSGNTPWGMYTKTKNSGTQANIWYGPYNNNNGYSGGDVYSGTDYAASTSSGLFLDDVNGTRYYGAWTTITMPYDIILKRIHLYQGGSTDSANTKCIPEDGVILGSHNGSDWYHVHTFTGLTYGGSVGTSSYSAAGESVVVNAIHSYKHYALVTTRTLHYAFTVLIGELYWYGTPAPSGLEDGHLTLGKALTLPRVSGHPAGAETPRAESLVVHYDTTVDSVVSGSTVFDSSGSGIHGTLVGAVYSSLDRALTFDGTNDYIEGTLNNPAGAWVHTVSCWYKADTPDNGVVWAIGSNSTNKQIAVNNVNGDLYYHIYGCNSTPQVAVNLSDGVWHHLVAVFKNSETTATNGVITGRTFYMDGVEVPLVASNNQVALNLNANSTLRLANQYNAEYQQGFISNFKIWSDVALTAGEVAMEYALGRTGKAINVTDTAVCIGGTTPTAQLDVRGSIVAAGSIQFTNPRFFAYSYNGNTSFSGGDTLVYNLTEYNIGSCYSTSTGYFTAPVNGVYHFTVAIYSFTALEYAWKMIQTAGSISMNNMHVSRNNGTGDDLLLTSVDANRVISSSIIVYLRIGEQFGWGSRSGSGSFYKAHGHFSGHLISRV